MSLTKIDPQVRRMVLDLAQDPHDPRKYKCAGCGRKFGLNAVNIDHVVPESESFPDARSDPDNLQVLCNPKGSTRLTSCHKKKSAAEARDRARRNRIPIDWTRVLGTGSLACMAAGYSALSIWDGPITPEQWLPVSAAGTGLVLSTILVKNAWSQRSPREVIQPEPKAETEPEPRLDTERIIEAVREVVGQRGVVEVVDVQDLAAFTVTYKGSGFPDHIDDKKFDFLNKVTAKIGDRWIADWDTMNDSVRLTRRPPLPKKIHHPGLDKDRLWHVLPVAEGAAFDLLVTPHVLIAGETAAGKTAMMRAMIIAASHSAAKHDNVDMNLADPKRIEMMGFRGWPGVKRIITDPEDLWYFAFEMKAEMDRRYDLIESGKAKAKDFKRIINFWDEQEEFYNAVFGIWTSGEKDEDDKPFKKPGERTPGAIRAVASLLAMSRRCGIHNIIATQSPDALIFGKSGVRQNMPGRASVGAIDDIRARWLYQDSSVGRDIPSSAKGRATVQIGDGKPFEIQTFWVPDPADADPNYANDEDDWSTLLRLGMPATHVPESFRHLLEV